jgi:hypothetical protein
MVRNADLRLMVAESAGRRRVVSCEYMLFVPQGREFQDAGYDVTHVTILILMTEGVPNIGRDAA